MELDGWRSTTLAEIADGPEGLQTGPFGSQLKASEYTAEGVPVVMPKDMANGRFQTDSIARVPKPVAERLSRHRVQVGDILFGRRGDIGRCALIEANQAGWLCGTGCLRFRPGGGVAPKFLAQLLGAPATTRWLEENAVGQTMLNLNTEILGRLPVLIPPLPEQLKIATILFSIDETIEKSQAVLNQLEVIKKGLLGELLTRGEGEPKDMAQTPIGPMPVSWEVAPLESLILPGSTISYGVVQPGPPDEYGVKLVRSGDLPDGEVSVASLRTISQRVSATYARTVLRGGEVLVALVGQPGACAVAPASIAGANVARQVAVIRPGARIKSHFLREFLLSPIGQEQLLQKTIGSVQQVINLAELKKVLIPVPPAHTQDELVQPVVATRERITQEVAVLSQLKFIKIALLDALLTGSLRISVSSQEAA